MTKHITHALANHALMTEFVNYLSPTSNIYNNQNNLWIIWVPASQFGPEIHFATTEMTLTEHGWQIDDNVVNDRYNLAREEARQCQ